MKAHLLLIIALIFYTASNAQIVNIPDANFKNALVNTNCVDTDGNYQGDDDVDTNNDGEIQVAEAEAVTWYLDIHDQNISSMEGIHSFVNLERLGCWDNQLTTLDLTLNVSLERLYCGKNQLTSIDITQNLQLDWLQCEYNQLTSLDLTQNPNLEKLYCHDNLLTNILLSQNTSLHTFYCNNNQLTQLDIAEAPNLVTLHCEHNQLTSLDLNQNQTLAGVYCGYNQLTVLDISQNTSIGGLYCGNNQLTVLNLKTGDNGPTNMRSFGNPNLFCIQVDDENYPRECFFWGGGWCKDPWAEYSEDCNLGVGKYAGKNITLYPNPVNNLLNITAEETINSVSISNVLGQLIYTSHVDALNTTIDMSAYTSGTYFVNVTIGGNTTTKKFIIE